MYGDDPRVRQAMNVKRQRQAVRRQTIAGFLSVIVGLTLDAAFVWWFSTWDGVNNGDSWLPLALFIGLLLGAYLVVDGIVRIAKAA